jgi:MFS family permease
MNNRNDSIIKPELKIFFIIVAITGFGMAMSDSIMANFFKDAYNVSAVQRGFLEFPREFPGILCFLVVAFTSSFGDVRLAIVSQLLTALGALVLGLFTPAFAIMVVFLFINSVGMHLYIPLQDSIGMFIIGEENLGKRMGQYNGIRTAFAMIASAIIFFGFRAGFFSLKTQIKIPFLISAIALICIMALYFVLFSKYHIFGEIRKKRVEIILKKEYKFYYILAVLHGVQKQIMFVFAPWVLIEILSRKADTLALLGIISSFCGIFFLPTVGRWIDRYGTKKLLLAEGCLFVAVYSTYGILSSGFTSGNIAITGFPVIFVCGLFIFDRLTMQLGMVRTAYLKSIAVDPADITPTLSTAISMDHVVSSICAYMGGLMWNEYGPQYVFFIAAGLSLLNVIVAVMIKPQKRAII